jgi:hypothetical protein
VEVKAVRTSASGRSTGVLRALDMRGLNVAETNFDFAGKRETTSRFELPVELRNEIARIDIASEASAGAVSLLDTRFKRRRVGLVSGATVDVVSLRRSSASNDEEAEDTACAGASACRGAANTTSTPTSSELRRRNSGAPPSSASAGGSSSSGAMDA